MAICPLKTRQLMGYGWIPALAMMFLPAVAAAETINSALIAAYNNNPTLNAQRAATRVADESIPLAKSGYRPTITGTANIGLSKSIVSGLPGSNVVRLAPGQFGVVINQTLWDSLLTQNNVSAARSAVSAQQEALRNSEQNILFNAAAAYLDVLRDRAIVVFQRRSLEFLQEQVRTEQARFDVGEA
ncbi:MAG: TolC family protein, partial [Pseudomonadota bacterium]